MPDQPQTKWSLSEYLNHVELRSQTWAYATLGSGAGFSVPHDECFYFYAVLQGVVRLAGVGGDVVELGESDIAFVLSGEAHALRSEADAAASLFDFLASGQYVDAPASYGFGDGRPQARLLCGRLLVRWPAGQRPRTLPQLLRVDQRRVVDFATLIDAARGPGAAAVLTRLANLLFVETFRRSPECQAVFRDSSLHDPIARAVQYIEMHPFSEWTVAALARKVGMGRASFAARFVAKLSRTPFDMITGERMRHASAMLIDTNLKVAEIAERVGYRSEAAFSRRFAAHFGQSPGAVRRSGRGRAA